MMKNAFAAEPSIKRYFAIMLAVYAVWIGLYYLTGWIGSVRGPAFDPALPIDTAIPYVPELLPIYFLAYIIIPGIFLIARDPAFLDRAYLTIIIANALAFACFAAFPAMGPERIPAIADGSWAQELVALTHGMDSRYNAFPSLHVANPWLLFLLSASRRGAAWVTWLFLALAIGISAATVFVKQHYVLDVAGGLLLAFFIWGLVYLRKK